jgi:hypothetical protein
MKAEGQVEHQKQELYSQRVAACSDIYLAEASIA